MKIGFNIRLPMKFLKDEEVPEEEKLKIGKIQSSHITGNQDTVGQKIKKSPGKKTREIK